MNAWFSAVCFSPFRRRGNAAELLSAMAATTSRRARLRLGKTRLVGASRWPLPFLKDCCGQVKFPQISDVFSQIYG